MRYEPLNPDLGDALAELFEALRAAGAERWFHPHPLTRDELEQAIESDDPRQFLIDLLRKPGSGSASDVKNR